MTMRQQTDLQMKLEIYDGDQPLVIYHGLLPRIKIEFRDLPYRSKYQHTDEVFLRFHDTGIKSRMLDGFQDTTGIL